jgi:hypothetical protein
VDRSRFGLLLGAVALVVSLFLPWREPAEGLFAFGALDRLEALDQNGWERWEAFDIALTVLAAAFVAHAALPRPPQWLTYALAGGAAASAVLLVATAFDEETVGVAGGQAALLEPQLGPAVALAALVLAFFALADRARRTL